jgi:hypothetical protein
MKRKTTIALVAIALLLVPLVWAISTTTLVHFYINSVVAYTLTLPGESAVNANSTGAPTLGIVFTSATGTDTNVEAQVEGGNANWQNATTPIFLFDNTGTVDLNITVALNATTRPCINFTGAATHAAALTGTVIGTTPVTVVNNFAPSALPQEWYMVADFSACNTGDSSYRLLTSTGVQS